MRLDILISDIKEGKYNAVLVGMLPKDYVVLPRDVITDLLVDLEKRRKVMSRGKGIPKR